MPYMTKKNQLLIINMHGYIIDMICIISPVTISLPRHLKIISHCQTDNTAKIKRKCGRMLEENRQERRTHKKIIANFSLQFNSNSN